MKSGNTLLKIRNYKYTKHTAFTLAEVLITLSILGVVAAMTIPSLVNRHADMAALTKVKKAVSVYENLASAYMAQNQVSDLKLLAENCDNIRSYFKVTKNSGCLFTTPDGVYWSIDENGYAYVQDSIKSPKFGVVMWAVNGHVNGTGETENGVSNMPAGPNIVTIPALTLDAGYPTHGIYPAAGEYSITNQTVKTAIKANDHTGIGVGPAELIRLDKNTTVPVRVRFGILEERFWQ